MRAWPTEQMQDRVETSVGNDEDKALPWNCLQEELVIALADLIVHRRREVAA